MRHWRNYRSLTCMFAYFDVYIIHITCSIYCVLYINETKKYIEIPGIKCMRICVSCCCFTCPMAKNATPNWWYSANIHVYAHVMLVCVFLALPFVYVFNQYLFQLLFRFSLSYNNTLNYSHVIYIAVQTKFVLRIRRTRLSSK